MIRRGAQGAKGKAQFTKCFEHRAKPKNKEQKKILNG